MPKSKPPYSTAAIHLADAILKASGSNLKNYTMVKTRNEIIGAAQDGIDAATKTLLDALKDAETEIENLLEDFCKDEGPEADSAAQATLATIRAAIAKAQGA